MCQMHSNKLPNPKEKMKTKEQQLKSNKSNSCHKSKLANGDLTDRFSLSALFQPFKVFFSDSLRLSAHGRHKLHPRDETVA